MQKNDTKPFSLWDIPLALVLLTRLPLPRLPDPVFSRQAQATWAFPLVGLVVAGLACLVGWSALALGLPVMASAGLLLATLIATTGAMHEDGLADTFDGLWGGFTRDRRLEIMKDSHIGTYGVLALIMSQLVRISAIAALLTADAVGAIIAACIVSRALMPLVMAGLPHARKSGLSHSVGKPQKTSVVAALGLAAALAFLLIGAGAIAAMGFAIASAAILAFIAKTKIGGQTGDILGATQLVSEITFLLTCVALI
ncbi:adenosylcobinamide-GDP ribazoletransferase [Ruegeria sp. 6PALISEP08]|uniref:adenosylcobinamide-GDP ribazoletransferase n=1 Tax=Ruegeria sp. 6PALISEP08 TaxID=1225660 RepID=UPI00067E6D93|nr:adenosylcobinamide-GDP ribazoletransferase [Ruegeria sp. 6PALISEP08]